MGKCVNCKMVANSLMSSRCQCTGKFEQTIGNMSPEKLTNPNLLNQMTDIRLFVRLYCPLPNKMNLARRCHPFRLPLPRPVFFVHLFVSPWVKHPPGDLDFCLCAHLDLFHQGAFCLTVTKAKVPFA